MERGLKISELMDRWQVERDRVKAMIDSGALETFVVPPSGSYKPAVRIKLSSIEAIEGEDHPEPKIEQPNKRRPPAKPRHVKAV